MRDSGNAGIKDVFLEKPMCGTYVEACRFPVTLDQAVEVMRVVDEARRGSDFEYIA